MTLFGIAGDAIAHARTDDDGRVPELVGGPLDCGTYRIEFDTGAYFAATDTTTFYPCVSVSFTVAAPDAGHHVPLLLSPYAFSTYRGS